MAGKEYDAESSHRHTAEELLHEDLTMRLYLVEGCSRPVLYIHSEPYSFTNFPLSHSAFFSVADEQAKKLLSGYQCGGSLGGDFVHLWFDREDEAAKIGTSGEFGGFGGNSFSHEIYSYEPDGIEKTRFHNVTQETGNPYTKETILEAEYLSEYTIDGDQTTPGQYYERLRRYQF